MTKSWQNQQRTPATSWSESSEPGGEGKRYEVPLIGRRNAIYEESARAVLQSQATRQMLKLSPDMIILFFDPRKRRPALVLQDDRTAWHRCLR